MAEGDVAANQLAIAVRMRWVGAWWLTVPTLTLLAGIVGVCGVAGDL